MTAFKKWPAYQGVLQEPIKFPHLIFLKHHGDMEQACEEYKLYLLKNRVRKLDALLNLYEIEPKRPESYLALAYALASRHVPGFEIEDLDKLRARLSPRRGPGRPANKTNPERVKAEEWLESQYCDIRIRNPLVSMMNACDKIRKRKDFPIALYQKNTPLSAKRLCEIIKNRRISLVDAILKRVSEGTWPA